MAAVSPRAQRYLFDRGFDSVTLVAEVEQAPPPEPVFTREDVDTARAEGRAQGRAEIAGEQETHRAAERARQASLDAIADEVRGIVARLDAVVETAGADAVRIALAVARKLLPSRWREAAADEIEDLVRRTMAELTDRAVVAVHVAPSLLDELAPRLPGPATSTDGAVLRLVADAALAEGDCRLEWSGGGAAREQRALWSDVESMVEHAYGAGTLLAPAGNQSTRMDNGDE